MNFPNISYLRNTLAAIFICKQKLCVDWIIYLIRWQWRRRWILLAQNVPTLSISRRTLGLWTLIINGLLKLCDVLCGWIFRPLGIAIIFWIDTVFFLLDWQLYYLNPSNREYMNEVRIGSEHRSYVLGNFG